MDPRAGKDLPDLEQIYLHGVLTIHCGALLEDSNPDDTLVCLKPPGHPGKHYDRDFRRYW